MLDFLKKIFLSKNREITFVLFDDQEPESSTSYKFKPEQLLFSLYGLLAVTILVVLLVIMFTPLGSLVYNSEDAELRQSVINVSKEISALKDSLNARDEQLADIKNVLSTDKDTIFSVNPGIEKIGTKPTEEGYNVPGEAGATQAYNMISQNEIIFSGLFKHSPEFPTFYPVEGTLTRGYNTKTGHYGIDIATKNNTSFKAIANGAIISQVWTFNYGYVLHIQHSNGIITVYKHASSVTKSVGDIVLKGDILGTVGDVGVLSSGPHLHLEIWKDGVPQDPAPYLIKS